VDLSHALWIGGGQASGKSTVARALARRFDLQLYVVDHRTWVHEPRMPSTELASRSMDERWLEPSPQRMLDWFVSHSRHRFRLVLEDLAALPDSPLAVVEGPQLLPTSVAAVLRSPDQALFLLLHPDEQRARLLARPGIPGTSDPLQARVNATERDLMITQLIERDARELRLRAVEVDRPLDEMVELAAEHFRPAIERGPREVDLAAVRRSENDVLAEQVRRYRASLDPVDVEDWTLPFACECGAPGCAAEIELPLRDYESLSAAGDRRALRAPAP
jgi:hypothetical protein